MPRPSAPHRSAVNSLPSMSAPIGEERTRETIFKWVTTLVTADVFPRRGVNSNDPLMAGVA
jgi:hypothetical protein